MSAEPCSTATKSDLEQLEKFLQVQIDAESKLRDQQHRAAEQAITRAENELARRLLDLNHWQEATIKNNENFVRKEEAAVLRIELAGEAKAQAARVEGLISNGARLEGMMKTGGVVLALLSLAISAGGLFLRHP